MRFNPSWFYDSIEVHFYRTLSYGGLPVSYTGSVRFQSKSLIVSKLQPIRLWDLHKMLDFLSTFQSYQNLDLEKMRALSWKMLQYGFKKQFGIHKYSQEFWIRSYQKTVKEECKTVYYKSVNFSFTLDIWL